MSLVNDHDLRGRGLLLDLLALHFSGGEGDGVGSRLRGLA